MRKLVFTALAVVFMLSSGFAKIEIENLQESDKEVFFDCTYDIIGATTNSFGQPVTVVQSFSVETIGRADCEGVINYHLTALRLGILKW